MTEPGAIVISVNGTERRLPEAVTLGELLETLGVRREGVAVAIDRQVVPRSQLDEIRVAHGQRIEILRAVGGG